MAIVNQAKVQTVSEATPDKYDRRSGSHTRFPQRVDTISSWTGTERHRQKQCANHRAAAAEQTARPQCRCCGLTRYVRIGNKPRRSVYIFASPLLQLPKWSAVTWTQIATA